MVTQRQNGSFILGSRTIWCNLIRYKHYNVCSFLYDYQEILKHQLQNFEEIVKKYIQAIVFMRRVNLNDVISAHFFFDDAMESYPENKSNYRVNTFVKALVRSINKAAKLVSLPSKLVSPLRKYHCLLNQNGRKIDIKIV